MKRFAVVVVTVVAVLATVTGAQAADPGENPVRTERAGQGAGADRARTEDRHEDRHDGQHRRSGEQGRSGDHRADRPPVDDPTPEPAETTGLRLNDIQARGTHNSTHLDPKGVVTDGDPFNWGYSHRTLTGQLEEQGVRQVEIDVHYNWAKDDFDVYHVWFGDDRTTCDTLAGCLGEIRDWSDDHPSSAPLMLLIEPKDAGAPYSLASGSTDPESHLPEDGDPFTRPLDEAAYDRLDELLLASFGGSMADGGRVVTPDDVNADGTDLRTTITGTGWPLLDDVRGHVLFVLDGDDHAVPYSGGYTSLDGRTMFVQAPADAPVAAFVSRDGTRVNGETKYERMARLVADGFMIRDLTSPDQFEVAKAAGAHFLSTDFPDRLTLSKDPDAPSRCNPVTISTSARTCTDTDIEQHPAHDYPVPADPGDGYDQVAADEVDRSVVGSVESVTALAEAPPGSRLPIG